MSNYDTAEGIRRSDLWQINKSPAHFKYYIEHRPEPTKALLFGAAVHKYVLEPETFWNEYAIAPTADRRTKEGKTAFAEFQQRCLELNLTGITLEDLEQCKAMAEALKDNALALKLLQGEHEKPFFWFDDLTGEKCKCKIDCLTMYEGKPVIVDYKTTDSCEDGHFERSAKKYGYQFQAGMYCEGLFQNTFIEHGFIFVAQEKTPPYASRVYLCDPEWIRRGYDKFRELIGIYHECKINDTWPGYELPVELLEV